MKRIRFLQRPQGAFQDLPPGPKRTIRSRLRQLAAGAMDLDVAPIIGSSDPPLLRLRAGSYRVAFYATAEAIVVVRIFHRSIGYDWLDGEEGAP